MGRGKRQQQRVPAQPSALDETSGAPAAEDIASDEPGEHGDAEPEPEPAPPAAAELPPPTLPRPVPVEPPPPDALVIAPQRGQPVLYHVTDEVDDLGLILNVYPDGVCDLVTFHAPRSSAHGGAPQASTFRGRVHPGKGVGEWLPLPAGS